jgi:hypothetical protein
LICENVRLVQDQIDQPRSTPEPAEDTDTYLGAAWPSLHRRDRDTILQPSKPDIIPARAILDRAPGRQPLPFTHEASN